MVVWALALMLVTAVAKAGSLMGLKPLPVEWFEAVRQLAGRF